MITALHFKADRLYQGTPGMTLTTYPASRAPLGNNPGRVLVLRLYTRGRGNVGLRATGVRNLTIEKTKRNQLRKCPPCQENPRLYVQRHERNALLKLGHALSNEE